MGVTVNTPQQVKTEPEPHHQEQGNRKKWRC